MWRTRDARAAALAEVEEESGLTGVRLLGGPGAGRLPAVPEHMPGCRCPGGSSEHPADNHLPERHMHIDHQ